MSEQVFYESESGDITVTNSRFVAGGETYAMQGVTSVRGEEEVRTPSKRGPLIVIGIGAIVTLFGFGDSLAALVLGLALVAGGVYWWTRLKDVSTFSVVLRSASGESTALSSPDGDFIRDVVSAVNEALVARG